MAFNVSGLSEYVKVNDREIALEIVSKAKTFDFLVNRGQVIFGLKTKEQIRLMSNSAYFQAGEDCGFNALGDTTLTGKTIEGKPIKDQSEVCFKTLYNTIFNAGIALGQDPESEVNDEVYRKAISNKTDVITAKVEKLMWQGNTGLTASYGPDYTNMNKIDGFLKKIATAGTSSIVLTGVTGSNVVEQLLSTYNAIPIDIASHPNFVMWIGEDTKRLYRSQLSFLPNKVVNDVQGYEKLFATDALLLSTPGLNGMKKVVFGLSDDFVALTDQGNEWTEAKIWYSEDTEKHKMSFRFMIGVEIVHLNQVGAQNISY